MANDDPFYHGTESNRRTKKEVTDQDFMDSFLMNERHLTPFVEGMNIVMTLIFSTFASDIPYLHVKVIQPSKVTAYMISVKTLIFKSCRRVVILTPDMVLIAAD